MKIKIEFEDDGLWPSIFILEIKDAQTMGPFFSIEEVDLFMEKTRKNQPFNYRNIQARTHRIPAPESSQYYKKIMEARNDRRTNS